jgi:hypothetical protein
MSFMRRFRPGSPMRSFPPHRTPAGAAPRPLETGQDFVFDPVKREPPDSLAHGCVIGEHHAAVPVTTILFMSNETNAWS